MQKGSNNFSSLYQNTITKSNIGAGMAIKAGSMFERVKFYGPYIHMEQAQQLVDMLFSEDPNDEYVESEIV